MKRLINLTAVVISVLAVAGTCLAGETRTIRISVTIPAIPGVNVPPYALDNNTRKTAAQDNVARKDTFKEADAYIMQEEKRDNAELAKEETTVKTLYSR